MIATDWQNKRHSLLFPAVRVHIPGGTLQEKHQTSLGVPQEMLEQYQGHLMELMTYSVHFWKIMAKF